MTPEGRVKADVYDWLKANMLGAWLYAPPGGAFGRAGTPDRLGLWRGVFFAIEIKRDRTNTVTNLQLKRLLEIKSAGGMALVLYGFEEQKLIYIRNEIVKRTPNWVDDDRDSVVQSIQLSNKSW
jgi:penicillin-binding protein-related factor A (putative recombinase)